MHAEDVLWKQKGLDSYWKIVLGLRGEDFWIFHQKSDLKRNLDHQKSYWRLLIEAFLYRV